MTDNMADNQLTGRRRQLLVRLGIQDMVELAHGEHRLQPYDGFVWGHHGRYEQQVAQLQAEGLVCFRYFNMLHYQAPENRELFPQWQFEVMLSEWRAYRAKPPGDPALYREDSNCMLIGWDQLHLHHNWQQALLEKLLNMSVGCKVVLGGFWRWDYPWMYHHRGSQFSDFSATDHLRWWLASNSFLRKAYEMGIDLLISGDNTVGYPGCLNHPPVDAGVEPTPEDVCFPVVLAHAETDMEEAYRRLEYNPERSVLSVDATHMADVDAAVMRWMDYGGWLAFSGPRMEVAMAYRHATEIRARGEQAVAKVQVVDPRLVEAPAPPPASPAKPSPIKPVRRQIPRLQKEPGQ